MDLTHITPKIYPYAIMNDPLVQKARAFAMVMHESINQRRKFTNEPYIVHPEEVATTIARIGGSLEQVCAGFLHDTKEDVGVTRETIEAMFGTIIADYVDQLSDVSKPTDGPRAKRKAIDRAHTAKACPEAKTVKLADVLSNISSICDHDKQFGKVYLQEKAQLIPFLKEGDRTLFIEVRDMIDAYQKKLQ